MKKEGFTLIELLAVIVIIAIIALIATPTILGVIEKARKEAAKNSALGYIDAVEKYIMTMDISNKNITNGTYKDSELEVEYKGKGPDNALVTVEKGIVKEAKICISKYSFDYDGEKVTNSVNNYCSDNYKIKLVIDDNMEEKSIEKELSTTFELSDITNKTNIVCNNGAVPTLENNILTISNIFGDTTCKINNTLEDTINNIDNTQNSIIMISDEEITNTLTIEENKNVILDLNGKIIKDTFNEYKEIINNKGSFCINDSLQNGGLIGNYELIKNTGIAIINSGKFYRNSIDNSGNAISVNNGTFTVNDGVFISDIRPALGTTGNDNNFPELIINGGEFQSQDGWATIALGGKNGSVIINGGKINNINNQAIYTYSINSIITINGGIISSQNKGAIVLGGGSNNLLNIYNGYIYTKSTTSATIDSWVDSNNININGKKVLLDADGNWKSGVLIESCGNNGSKNCNDGYMNFNLTKVNKINIDGGTFVAYKNNMRLVNGIANIKNSDMYSFMPISQAAESTSNILNLNNSKINIDNVKLISSNKGIINWNSGIINVCNVNINCSDFDFYNKNTGTINYSSDVIFTDGTNNPNTYNPNGTVNANYTGTCSY